MKPFPFKFLAGAPAAAALAIVGCTHQQLLSPIARAFGAPPEPELVECRIAFRQLQARLETCRVRVEPVMFASGGDGLWREGDRQWRTDLAQRLIKEAGTRTKAVLEMAGNTPEVAFPKGMYHNQLHYLWDRAEAYSRWVKSTHPAADFVLIVEIFDGAGKREGAAQVYVFDAQGQLAVCRLLRFPGTPPGQGPVPIRPPVDILFETLRLDADVVFPPYGWG